MRNLLITLSAILVTMSSYAQWSGSTDVNGAIQRNGNILVNGLGFGRYGSPIVNDTNPYSISTTDGERHDLMIYGSNTATLDVRIYDGDLKMGPYTNPYSILYNSGGAYFSGSIGIGVLQPSSKLHVYDNSRDYKINKPILGNSENALGINYILLHRIYEGVDLADHFVMGKITGIRGGGSAWNRKFTVDVSTASAYKSNRGSVVSYNESTRLVTVTYNSIRYLALEIASNSSIHYFSFTGYAQNETLQIVYDQNVSNPQPFLEYDPIGINGEKFFVAGNGNVGYGTSTPAEAIHVNSVGNSGRVNARIGRWASFGETYSGLATIIGTNVKASNAAVHRMEFIESTVDGGKAIKMQYNEGISFHTFQGQVSAGAEFSGYERMRIDNSGNVGIGTTNPNQKLTVNGTIYGKEVKVDMNVPGPDYVFEPTYNLLTLAETEAYIKTNKHLPEVPSAKEMEANGINLSEMNMLLLKKVEELTLHLIRIEKDKERQQRELNELREKYRSQ